MMLRRAQGQYTSLQVVFRLRLTLHKALSLQRALSAQALLDILPSCGALEYISIIRLSIPLQKEQSVDPDENHNALDFRNLSFYANQGFDSEIDESSSEGVFRVRSRIVTVQVCSRQRHVT